jgi:hypothetical protein
MDCIGEQRIGHRGCAPDIALGSQACTEAKTGFQSGGTFIYLLDS